MMQAPPDQHTVTIYRWELVSIDRAGYIVTIHPDFAETVEIASTTLDPGYEHWFDGGNGPEQHRLLLVDKCNADGFEEWWAEWVDKLDNQPPFHSEPIDPSWSPTSTLPGAGDPVYTVEESVASPKQEQEDTVDRLTLVFLGGSTPQWYRVDEGPTNFFGLDDVLAADLDLGSEVALRHVESTSDPAYPTSAWDQADN